MLLDFEDPLTVPFKVLLLSCTTRDIYLKADEVRPHPHSKLGGGVCSLN